MKIFTRDEYVWDDPRGAPRQSRVTIKPEVCTTEFALAFADLDFPVSTVSVMTFNRVTRKSLCDRIVIPHPLTAALVEVDHQTQKVFVKFDTPSWVTIKPGTAVVFSYEEMKDLIQKEFKRVEDIDSAIQQVKADALPGRKPYVPRETPLRSSGYRGDDEDFFGGY